MASRFTGSADQNRLSGRVNDLNTGITVASIAGVLNPFAYIGVASMVGEKNAINSYLGNLDLLASYDAQLEEISGSLIASRNDLFTNQGFLSDLDSDKADFEDFLEDYRQMLAGEGDSDNLILAQDRLNQASIESAEDDLSAYRDSSALELDAAIQQGFSSYTSQRQQEAIQNIYASATGSVVGAYNGAARRTRAAIKAFVGSDMKFNQVSGDGRSTEMMGSFAKMMLSNRQIIRNNVAKYQSNIDAAKLAFNSYREELAEYAEEGEQFMEDYDSTRKLYEENLAYARDQITALQEKAQALLGNASSVLEDVNAFEEKHDLDSSEWTWDEEAFDVDTEI